MRTKNLLSRDTVTESFTAVYILVDDYLKASVKQGRFRLPEKPNQKGSYSELFTIALVGELLQQKNQGLGSLLVQSEYQDLFPKLPDLTRCYRIGGNFEPLYADFALRMARHDGVYLIDSKPVPICKGVRHERERLLTEAVKGKGGATKFF